MVFRYLGTRYPIYQLRREMDRLLSGFVGNVGERNWPMVGRGRPAVNVWEVGEAIKLEVELPGVQSDQIELSVVGDELSIKVQRPDAVPQDATYHRRERSVGEFARVVRLPVEVDADRVEAELRHGVLTITLPKAESARPRKIQVTPAG